jgi:hypothetical protein
MKTSTPRIKYRILVPDDDKDEFRELMYRITDSRINPKTGKQGAMVITTWRQTIFSNLYYINLTDNELLIAKLSMPSIFKPMDDVAKAINGLKI